MVPSFDELNATSGIAAGCGTHACRVDAASKTAPKQSFGSRFWPQRFSTRSSFCDSGCSMVGLHCRRCEKDMTISVCACACAGARACCRHAYMQACQPIRVRESFERGTDLAPAHHVFMISMPLLQDGRGQTQTRLWVWGTVCGSRFSSTVS